MIRTQHVRCPLLAFVLWGLSASAIADAPAGSSSGDPEVAGASFTIELNKLEEADGACRAYLVFENKTDASYTTLKLDLVMFGSDGVISKRLAVEGAPLPPQKTSVKLFEIRDVTCGSIARILLNDVISCRDDAGEHGDCVQRITTRSLGTIEFFK